MRCQLPDWNLISPQGASPNQGGDPPEYPRTLPTGPMPGTRATNQATPHSPKQSAGGACWTQGTNSHHRQHTPLSLPKGDTVQRQVPSMARQEAQPEPSRRGHPSLSTIWLPGGSSARKGGRGSKEDEPQPPRDTHLRLTRHRRPQNTQRTQDSNQRENSHPHQSLMSIMGAKAEWNLA